MFREGGFEVCDASREVDVNRGGWWSGGYEEGKRGGWMSWGDEEGKQRGRVSWGGGGGMKRRMECVDGRSVV